MKKLLLAVIPALTIMSAQGRIGLAEAEAIRVIAAINSPKDVGPDWWAKKHIIELTAMCKYGAVRIDPKQPVGLSNTDCKRLVSFMFNALNNDSRQLPTDVYKNIEDSMLEITEAQAKLKSKES